MHQIASDPTVAEFLEFWLREHVTHNLRPRTGEGYATVVHRHLNPLLGPRLRALSSLQVLEVISAKREEGLSPRSLQYLHAVLRSALTSAVRLGLVERNAASGIPSPHYRSHGGAPLSQQELSCLVGAARGDRNAGQLIDLLPHQEAILWVFTTSGRTGGVPHTLIYSAPKKSGKSTIGALLTRWVAETIEPFSHGQPRSYSQAPEILSVRQPGGRPSPLRPVALRPCRYAAGYHRLSA